MAESVGSNVKDKTTQDLSSPTLNVETRRPKRPDRKRYQEDLERLTNLIKAKEFDLKSLQGKGDPEVLQSRLRTLRQQKDEAIDTRRKIDERLLTVNKEITNKRDGLSRVHSTLKYKSEDWINEAIKRLEYQLQVHNFKVKEEKTIVKEIDTLNRSRRNLREYFARKAELGAMAKEQEGMRNQRDALFKDVTLLKIEEDKDKKEHAEFRSCSDKLKQELDQFHREKRNLTSEFRKACVEFNHLRVEQRQLNKKKADEKEDSKQNDEDGADVHVEQYFEDSQLCETLLTYLQRFVCGKSTSPSTPFSTSSLDTCESTSEGNTPVSAATRSDLEEEFILRKKNEGEWYYVGSKGARTKRNVKKEKKRQLQQQKKKCITHTPEIFAQFERLALKAPASMVDVPTTVEQLKGKKKYLEHMATSSPDQTSDYPLYHFAQKSSPSPPAEDDVPDKECISSIPASPDKCDVETEVKDMSSVSAYKESGVTKPDSRLKRPEFHLSLTSSEPSVSREPPITGKSLPNGNCDSDGHYSLANGFSTATKDDDPIDERELCLKKMNMLSISGHSQQLDAERFIFPSGHRGAD